VEAGQTPRLLQYTLKMANVEDQQALEKVLNERKALAEKEK